MMNQYATDPVAQILWTVGMALVFAIVGAGYTIYAARQNNEHWEWEKGKYEIIALGGAGALSGLYVLSTGGGLFDPIFVVAMTFAAKAGRKAYLVHTDSRDKYEELTKAGVEPVDAALLSIRHGVENNDLEEASEGFRQLFEQGGKPSAKKLDDNVNETRKRLDEDGLAGLFPDQTFEQVDDDPYEDESVEESGGESVDRSVDEPESAVEGEDEKPDSIEAKRAEYRPKSKAERDVEPDTETESDDELEVEAGDEPEREVEAEVEAGGDGLPPG